jgi:hypothetical protein
MLLYADAPLQVTQEGGDDRVSGSDADRHDDISRNGSSGFCGNADSAETADLGRVFFNAQLAAPRSVVQKMHSRKESL